MDRADVLEKIRGVIAETMDVDGQTITEATTFEDLDADSLDRIELVTALEDELGIQVSDDALESIVSVGDAVDAVVASL